MAMFNSKLLVYQRVQAPCYANRMPGGVFHSSDRQQDGSHRCARAGPWRPWSGYTCTPRLGGFVGRSRRIHNILVGGLEHEFYFPQ